MAQLNVFLLMVKKRASSQMGPSSALRKMVSKPLSMPVGKKTYYFLMDSESENTPMEELKRRFQMEP
jgi:ribosomal protein S6